MRRPGYAGRDVSVLMDKRPAATGSRNRPPVRRSAVRPPPGVRPLPGPAGARPRLVAGGPGWQRVARRLRRTRGRLHRALASTRGPRHRRTGGHTALLLDRRAEPAPRAAGGASGRALSRSARAGVLLQLGRGGERERACTWLARPPAVLGSSPCSVDGTDERPRRSRVPTVPATRRRRRGAASRSPPEVPADDVAALERAVDGDGRRGDPGAGAGPLRRAGLCAATSCTPPAGSATPRGAALLFDEVQCGVGRCGAFSAAGGGGRGPRRADLRQGPRLRSADRRRHRDAGDHRHHHHGRPGEHVRRRPGALRRRARQRWM